MGNSYRVISFNLFFPPDESGGYSLDSPMEKDTKKLFSVMIKRSTQKAIMSFFFTSYVSIDKKMIWMLNNNYG